MSQWEEIWRGQEQQKTEESLQLGKWRGNAVPFPVRWHSGPSHPIWYLKIFKVIITVRRENMEWKGGKEGGREEERKEGTRQRRAGDQVMERKAWSWHKRVEEVNETNHMTKQPLTHTHTHTDSLQEAASQQNLQMLKRSSCFRPQTRSPTPLDRWGTLRSLLSIYRIKSVLISMIKLMKDLRQKLMNDVLYMGWLTWLIFHFKFVTHKAIIYFRVGEDYSRLN